MCRELFSRITSRYARRIYSLPTPEHLPNVSLIPPFSLLIIKIRVQTWNPLQLLLRERERVNSSPGFPLPAQVGRHHTLFFGLVVTIGVLLYAVSSVWIYQFYKNGTSNTPAAFGGGGNTPSSPVTPPAKSREAGSGFAGQDLAPRDTPLLGPGVYACDEYGICNIYEDTKRAPCPKTYADRNCLNECKKIEVRCPKQL